MGDKEDKGIERRWTRRRFLAQLSLLVSGSVLGRCGASGQGEGSPDSLDGLGADGLAGEAMETRSAAHGDVLLGLLEPAGEASLRKSLRSLFEALDWSWLKAGDRVFVKLSCNSGNPHPAVTSPVAVAAVCEELLARGAGEVLAGDQGGVAWVRLAKGEKLWGATRNLMGKNGLLAAVEEAGAVPWLFEEHGYEEGYAASILDVPGHHWSDGPWLASVLNEVDHVVTLPRLSSHLIAGCSLGHKCAVGWLRDDSRYRLHFEGESFHEKLAELSFAPALRARHRLTITVAEKLLLDAGPDQGTIAEADPVLVIASPHLVNHDLVATAVMAYVDGLTPPAEQLLGSYGPEQADQSNRLLIDFLVPNAYGAPWGDLDPSLYTAVPYHEWSVGVATNRVLTRAYELLGGIPDSIRLRFAGLTPAKELRAFIEAFGGGVLRPDEG